MKANLEIGNGSSFTIDSTDTKWLKIYSNDTTAYNIKIYGSMKIDSAKITSWNPVKNNYPSEDFKPRKAYILVEEEATGTTDIFNSELGYLGYNQTSELGYLGYNSSYEKETRIQAMVFRITEATVV